MPKFLLDTNCFIQSHMQHYPLDVAQSFWTSIKQLGDSGSIISIEKVKREIYHYDGNVKNWIEGNMNAQFFKSSDYCIGEYAQLAQWADSRNSHYLPQAITDFLDADRADAWLIAHAKHERLTLVTYETPDPARKKSIKIPDACLPFNVPCINIIGMFRQLGVQW